MNEEDIQNSYFSVVEQSQDSEFLVSVSYKAWNNFINKQQHKKLPCQTKKQKKLPMKNPRSITTDGMYYLPIPTTSSGK